MTPWPSGGGSRREFDPGQAYHFVGVGCDTEGIPSLSDIRIKMRMPGVEPGSQAWEACMMPLHYMRSAHAARVLNPMPGPPEALSCILVKWSHAGRTADLTVSSRTF